MPEQDDLVERCFECNSRLDDDGTCWHCQYEMLQEGHASQEERYERRLRNLSQEKGDLENQVYRLEQELRNEKNKSEEYKRKYQDAESRSSNRW